MALDDPEVEALVQSLRNVLTGIPARHRSRAFAHVRLMLEVWGAFGRDDFWQHHPFWPQPSPEQETTTTPEDTLREAGISGKRQTTYQRRMSSLLAGRR